MVTERILITGGLGVVGKALTSYLMLRSENDMIFVTDTAPVGPGWMGTPDNNRGNRNVIYLPLDVTRPNDVATAFGYVKPTVVYNLAAIYGRKASEESPEKAFDVNVHGAYTVARLANQWDARLLHLSSGEVYGHAHQTEHDTPRPDNWYGITKWQGEVVTSYIHPTAVILRPFMLYDGKDPFGEHRSALVRFAEQIARGNKIEVHEGSERSWLHLSDAARMIGEMAFRKGPMVMNIGNPEPGWTASKLAETIASAQGMKLVADYITMPNKITAVKQPDLTRMLLHFARPLVRMKEGIPAAAWIIRRRVRSEGDVS
jgi:nucleoside-diphosphate-sugar epimerase